MEAGRNVNRVLSTSPSRDASLKSPAAAFSNGHKGPAGSVAPFSKGSSPCNAHHNRGKCFGFIASAEFTLALHSCDEKQPPLLVEVETVLRRPVPRIFCCPAP